MSLADLDLVDPDIPASALISDGAALRALLAEAGEDLRSRGYLRYKPGTSLVAALTLASGPAFAYAVSAPARPKLTKLAERAPRGSLVADDPNLLIARPAADRDLPGLADPARLAQLVGSARVAGLDGLGGPEQGWRTLAYKPQRRWVGRPAAGGDPVVLRAYRPKALAQSLDGWQLAARVADELGVDGAPGEVRLPRVLRSSSQLGLAAVSWLPGEPLDRVLTGRPAEQRDTLTEVGAALARVHGSLRCARVQPTPDVAEAARPVLRELIAVLPALRGRARALVAALAASQPRTTWAHPIHGDFSTDQVVVGADGRIGIADWDRAGWGDPGADLGSQRAAGMGEPAYQAFCAGYRSVRDLPATAGWHAVAGGVQRLTEPLRTCRQDWRAEIERRLSRLEGEAATLAADRVRVCA